MTLLLFAGNLYYPSGGWHDFITAVPSPDDAPVHLKDLQWDPSGSWAHVVSLADGRIVARFSRAKNGIWEQDPDLF